MIFECQTCGHEIEVESDALAVLKNCPECEQANIFYPI